MRDELLRGHHTIHVCAITDMQQHVGDARRASLLEGRQCLPDPMDLVLHRFFLLPHGDSHLLARLASHSTPLQPLVLFSLRRWSMQSHIPVLVNHVALRMPMLIHAIPEDLHKLL